MSNSHAHNCTTNSTHRLAPLNNRFELPCALLFLQATATQPLTNSRLNHSEFLSTQSPPPNHYSFNHHPPNHHPLNHHPPNLHPPSHHLPNLPTTKHTHHPTHPLNHHPPNQRILNHHHPNHHHQPKHHFLANQPPPSNQLPPTQIPPSNHHPLTTTTPQPPHTRLNEVHAIRLLVPLANNTFFVLKRQ